MDPQPSYITLFWDPLLLLTSIGALEAACCCGGCGNDGGKLWPPITWRSPRSARKRFVSGSCSSGGVCTSMSATGLLTVRPSNLSAAATDCSHFSRMGVEGCLLNQSPFDFLLFWSILLGSLFNYRWYGRTFTLTLLGRYLVRRNWNHLRSQQVAWWAVIMSDIDKTFLMSSRKPYCWIQRCSCCSQILNKKSLSLSLFMRSQSQLFRWTLDKCSWHGYPLPPASPATVPGPRHLAVDFLIPLPRRQTET